MKKNFKLRVLLWKIRNNYNKQLKKKKLLKIKVLFLSLDNNLKNRKVTKLKIIDD